MRPVDDIRVAYFGRFATRERGEREIVIWELESCAPGVALEFRVASNATGDSAACCFDWLPMGNGNHVLAVGSGKTVRLLQETGSKDVSSFAVSWREAAVFAGLNANCSSVSFLSDGSLVVGTNKEVVVFTKWWRDETLWSVFRASDVAQKPLPLYHPKVVSTSLVFVVSTCCACC